MNRIAGEWVNMKRKRVFAVFLAVVVLLSLTVTAFGGNSDEDHKSVKVAFVEQEGLMEKDEDGNLSGYSYDYICLLYTS